MGHYANWTTGHTMLAYMESGINPYRKLSTNLSIARGPIFDGWGSQWFGITHYSTTICGLIYFTKPVEPRGIIVIPRRDDGLKMRWSKITNMLLGKIEQFFSHEQKWRVIEVPYDGDRGTQLSHYIKYATPRI